MLEGNLAHLLATIDDYALYHKGWDGEHSEPYQLLFLFYAKDVVRALISSLAQRGLRSPLLIIHPENDSCLSLFCGHGGRSIELFIFKDDIDLTVFMSTWGEDDDRVFHFTPLLFSDSVFSREMDWLEDK